MEDVRGQAQRVADRGAETTAALTEANRRVVNEFMNLSMETFQEGARIFMQMQQNTLDMLREAQAAALSVWRQNTDGARKAFDAINGASEAANQSVSRLQSSARKAGNKLEHTRNRAASRMKRAA